MRSHLKMNNSAVYFHFSYLISDHLCPIEKSLVAEPLSPRARALDKLQDDHQ